MSLPTWASNSCFVEKRLPVAQKKLGAMTAPSSPLPDPECAELIPDRAVHTGDHQVDREREERQIATNLVELIDRALVTSLGSVTIFAPESS